MFSKAYSVKGFDSILVLLEKIEELRGWVQWEVLGHCDCALKGDCGIFLSLPPSFDPGQELEWLPLMPHHNVLLQNKLQS